MMYFAIPQTAGCGLASRLLDAAPLESGAFCRLRHVQRGGALRYVLGAAIESDEPWVAQGEERLTPSGKRISAAVSISEAEGCGLAFVHTHPMDRELPRFSRIDLETTMRLGRTFAELLDEPFASLVLSPGGWIGTLADSGGLTPLSRVAVVGDTLRIHAADDDSSDQLLDDRQVRALGSGTNRALRSLRVAVIGAGGIGSPVAETLARMGVGRIDLIDHDVLDTPSNARRMFGIGLADIDMQAPKAKARAVAEGLARLNLATELTPVVGDVREPEVQSHLLAADVIVSGTDTHSSRAAVSELAIRAAIPLIDTGVRVGARRSGMLDSLWLERRVQIPEGPCLWCWGTLDADHIRLELLPDAQRESLEREGYVTGAAGGPAPSVAALTVTAAGLAASAILAMLAGAFVGAPLGMGLDAITMESRPFELRAPDPGCICSRWRAGR
jgi:hypothetical protein